MNFNKSDTIVALATAHGSAAIAVIRLSGPNAIEIAEKYFYNKALIKKQLSHRSSHSLTFGLIVENGLILDEVLVAVFKSPYSYTGENSVEVSCHGSLYVQQQLLQLFLNAGARIAEPGEFTMRAFLNGKMDLSQAEAVADVIASNSPASHQVAMQQMRGGFSKKIALLRDQLIKFASLIELELDFSEEDVEFADRKDLRQLVNTINQILHQLVSSFEIGNVLKNGIPVAIIGKPNAGKSTLLNVLLNDERAIVSDIPGTTRDTIEDEIIIGGVLFRFIDTAGLRSTTDLVEKIGVDRAIEAMKKSAIVIFLFDANGTNQDELKKEINKIQEQAPQAKVVPVANKIDAAGQPELFKKFEAFNGLIFISAKQQTHIDELRARLLSLFNTKAVDAGETIVTNSRHATALKNAAAALQAVEIGLSQAKPGDLLALDIRFALQELGNITGQVTNEDLLTNIFTKFCIGK